MATKNEKVTSADLKAATGAKIDPSIFDTTQGEEYSGLNILKLEKGEAAGPFVLKKILEKQVLGKAPRKGKPDTRKPVDVYVAEHNKREVRMPIAAAFTMKAKEANLAPGDSFLVRRSEDYVSEFGSTCKGYQLKVTARAK
jgi:hypothetical protein